MTIIRKAVIENYQSIRKATLRFTPGLNVVIGRNGYGKSALTRALRLVCRDEFTGTFYIANGQTKTRVMLITKRGKVTRVVERTSGDKPRLKSNKYIVRTSKDPDNKQVFSKFGNTIPAEVMDVIGISPVLSFGAGRDDVIDMNFGHQQNHKGFLMSRPGSVAARVFSIAISLDSVLESMRQISKDRVNTNRDLKTLNAGALELSEQVDRFPVLELKQTFAVLDSKVSAVRDLRSRVKSLTSVREDLTRINRDGRIAKTRMEELHSVSDLPWGEAEEAIQQVIDLTAVSDSLSDINDSIRETKLKLSNMEVQADLVDQAITVLDQLTALSAIADVDSDIKQADKQVDRLRSELSEAEEEYDDLLHELGACPYCGSEVK